MKKIVILTRDDIEHHYVTNVLCENFNVSAVLVDLGMKRSLVGKIRYYFKKYELVKIPELFLRRIINWVISDSRKRKSSLLKVLTTERGEEFNDVDAIRYFNGLNKGEAVQFLEGIAPDYVLVYGTGIISKRVLSMSRVKTLNMHSGVSPYYRGAACAFWPLYNNELDMLGATVHECVPEVDGGEVYAVGKAKLDYDDDMHSVFARCVKVGADLYVSSLRGLLGGVLKGKRQDLGIGSEYLSNMKDWKKETCVRKKIRKGLIKDYLRGASIV
jgi:methionyl-tRNA formyltransferase